MRKRSIVLWACLGLMFQATAQNTKAILKEATVYPSGARLTFDASANVEAGRQTIVITGLPDVLDENSIRIAIEGPATLLALNVLKDYGERQMSQQLKVLNDSLNKFKKERELLQNQQGVLVGQENILAANNTLSNTQRPFTTVELKALLDFYANKALDIKSELMVLREKGEKLNDKINRLTNQIQQVTDQERDPVTQLEVNLISKSAGKNTFKILAFTPSASWVPVYELRATAPGKPIALSYRAQVYQNTNLLWDKIALSLSTGQVNQNNYLPEFNISYARAFDPPKYYAANRKYRTNESAAPSAKMESMAVTAAANDGEEDKYVYQAQQSQTLLSTAYTINLAQTIPTGNKGSLVSIEDYALPATFTYKVFPRMDQRVFLVAGITDFAQYSLLPAEATVFLGEAYIGKTYINPQVANDTLDISFGADDRIAVNRKRLKEYTAKKLIGTSYTETYGFEITCKNNNTLPIDITIVDQIPLSSGSDIEVNLIKNNDGKFNSENGKLEWFINLKPNQQRKLEFVYQVKYPKGKNLQIN